MIRKTVNVNRARCSCVILIAIGALGVLAGCAPTPHWMEWTKGNRSCPSASLSKKNTSYPLKFLSRGDQRHVTLSDLGVSCGVMPENMELIDEHEVGIVFTATVPDTEGKSGLGKRLHWIDVPVYVGIIDKKGKMVDRRDYEFSMTISDESTWSRQRVAYPLPSHIAANDPNYRVVVGLGGSGHRASPNNPLEEPGTSSQHVKKGGKKQIISALLPTSLMPKQVPPEPPLLNKITEDEGGQKNTESPVSAEKIKMKNEKYQEIIPPAASLERVDSPAAIVEDPSLKKNQIVSPEPTPTKVKESSMGLPKETLKEKEGESSSSDFSPDESASIPKPSTL